MGVVINYPEPTKVVVSDNEQTITVSTAAAIGPQGPAGPQGEPGPQGPAGEPEFYESSTQPLDPTRGAQWIVTTPLGGG